MALTKNVIRVGYTLIGYTWDSGKARSDLSYAIHCMCSKYPDLFNDSDKAPIFILDEGDSGVTIAIDPLYQREFEGLIGV